MNNKIQKFEKNLNKIIGDTFSYFDTGKKPEYAYHSYMLGLLAVMTDDYLIKSNKESGEGRYDILLLPFEKINYGIIIEVKTLENSAKKETIENKLQEALNQVEENEYYKELIDSKIENRIELALVFAGKKVFAKSQIV